MTANTLDRLHWGTLESAWDQAGFIHSNSNEFNPRSFL